MSFPLEAASASGKELMTPAISDFLQRIRSRPAYQRALDMTMKRAKNTFRRLASYLGVKEPEVVLWRAGITIPQGGQCRRLSQLLQVDVVWLGGLKCEVQH
jgi:hypothetical protein